MAPILHNPIFFEKINTFDGLNDEKRGKILSEIVKDYNILYTIWGRIMHYSTNIEHMLKEHLNYENRKITLGALIGEFKEDCKVKRCFTKYSKLISTLSKLNKKCRIIWSHGLLTYSLKKGRLIKHLIYAEKNRRRIWVKKKTEIDNDYFANVANILFPKVLKGLIDMYDARDLEIKTSFIVPVQKDNGVFDFIFVK